MTAPFGSRRRAEEFAARLEEGSVSVRGVPAGTRADGGSETDRLVGVVAGLREQAEHVAITPRAAFAVELRERLVAEATDVLPQVAAPASRTQPARAVPTGTRPHRTHGRRERRLVGAAVSVILLGGTAGMATAAQSALPGQALYPIKRLVERADVSLATTPAGRGRHLLHQASGRLVEVQGLAESGPVNGDPQIPGTLDVFNQQAHEGAGLMMQAYRETDDPEAIGDLHVFAAEQVEMLASLSSTTPTESLPQLQQAAMALTSIDQAARDECVACADPGPLEVPPVLTTPDPDHPRGTASDGPVADGPVTDPPVDSLPPAPKDEAPGPLGDNQLSDPGTGGGGTGTQPSTGPSDGPSGGESPAAGESAGAEDPASPGASGSPAGDPTPAEPDSTPDPGHETSGPGGGATGLPSPPAVAEGGGAAGEQPSVPSPSDVTGLAGDLLGDAVGDVVGDGSAGDGQ